MKKITIALALVGLFSIAPLAFADTPIYANGSPENVVNTWGTTNSQLPSFAPGETKMLANGMIIVCPFWYGNIRCVDVTATTWYKTNR